MDPRAFLLHWRDDQRAFWRQPGVLLQAALLLPCAVLFLAVASNAWEQVIDDAFITFRFSRNLVEGHGLVFNPGMLPVEGYTNFTWMLLAAVVYALGWDVLLWVKLAGLACGLGTLAATWRLTAELRAAEDPLNVLPALFLAANAHFGFWTVQGLETPLATLLIVLLALRSAVELREPCRLPLSPILAVLAWMTRPDAVVYFLPLGAWALWQLGRGEASRRRVLQLAGLALLLAVPYQLWRLWYFHDWLPNTFYAKVAGESANVQRALAHLHEFYLNQAGWPHEAGAPGGRFNSLAWTNLLLGSGLFVALLGTARMRFLVLGPVLCQTVYLVYTGADWMPGFRFFHSLLPFLGIGVAAAVDLVRASAAPHRWLARTGQALIAVAFFFAGTEQLRIQTAYVFDWNPQWVARPHGWMTPRNVARNFAKPFQPALLDVAEALLLHTRDGATIVMSDVGLPLWAAPHLTLIDVDGLTDKVVADAPSVRAARFGGIGIGDEDTSRRDAAAERAAAYALDVHHPEYVLAFEMHNGLGPDAPGFIYPELVARVLGRAEQDTYSEIWRGVKTDGDVWNHLLARPEAAAEVPAETRRARLLHAIALCPRVSGFVRVLHREFPGEEETRALIRTRAPRFASDVWFVRDVLYVARLAEDRETARIVYDAARRGPLGTEPWLYRMMAEVWLDSAEWRAAEAVFIEGIDAVPPTDTTLLYDLAWLREKRLADPEGAVAALEQVLARDPADEQARRERERLTAPEPTSRSEPTS